MHQKWTNPAYASISRKTRPAHLPSDVPFRRLRTHLVQEHFEYSSRPQRPGQRVLDCFSDQITVDTSSPKKGTEAFKAWVRELKIEFEQLHTEPGSVIIYTDGAFHHSDFKAAYAFAAHCNDTLAWHDHRDWCPAASSFDAEIRAIESALEYAVTRTTHERIVLIIDNKAAATSLFNFDVKSSQMSIVRINFILDSWLSESTRRSLTVRFAPSHEGIEGNERADQLTKAGLELCPTNPPPHLAITFPIRTPASRRARLATTLGRCHIQGVPVAPHSKKKEGFQTIVRQTCPQFLP
ncbi:hypothetical protein AX14_008464 [Amanita brunnescens Koide BX004]|nr:hypothetical protein AX14_008464 [Amanita brunnescens Koide BX004]